MFCTECGKENNNTARFCVACGTAIQASGDFQETQPVLKTGRREPSFEASASAKPLSRVGAFSADEPLWRAVIGPKKADSYLPLFAEFSVTGKPTASWNWPASLMTFFWLLHRKLWSRALVYFIVPFLFVVVVSAAQEGAGASSAGLFLMIWLVYLLALYLVPGLYGTGWLYKKYQAIIAEAKTKHRTPEAQVAYLSAVGGTGKAAVVYGLLLFFVVIFGILAAVAIPAYQDYTVRARMSQVNLHTMAVRSQFQEVYERTGRIPTHAEIAQVGMPTPLVREFVVTNSGAIQIVLGFEPVAGKRFVLEPTLDTNKQLVWTCTPGDVPVRFMPSSCRGTATSR
ncbi:pilin [Hydrogenophaga sp.]|uniref:pilin n=1 Tax=Hydrogenophaga sp. TaxID=1904254 RepID=UPI003F6EC781